MPYKDINKQREYQRRWLRRRRESFLADKKCERCNKTSNLELHHRDPDKKISHRVWGWSDKRREKELEKCDTLCVDCHKEITVDQLTVEHVHGTPYCYRSFDCRCHKCREAHRLYMRGYRQGGIA